MQAPEQPTSSSRPRRTRVGRSVGEASARARARWPPGCAPKRRCSPTPSRPSAASPRWRTPRRGSSTSAGLARSGACSSATGSPTCRTRSTIKFRGAFRQISKMMDERIEALTKGSEWDELARYLQTVVADEVTNTFVDLETGTQRASAPRWSSCSATSTSGSCRSHRSPPRSTSSEIWQSKALDPHDVDRQEGVRHRDHRRPRRPGRHHDVRHDGHVPAHRRRRADHVEPGAARHRRRVRRHGSRRRPATQDRRSSSGRAHPGAPVPRRRAVRDGQRDGNLVREIQRELRDEFSERIAELVRTYTETAQRAQADMQSRAQPNASNARRRSGAHVAAIDTLDARLATFTEATP